MIVIDGMGEAFGATSNAPTVVARPLHRISAANSIGILYSVVTLHLGFEFNSDEYKVMGLAPYGDPERFRSFFGEAIALRDDGGWESPLLKLNRTREEREHHTAGRRHLTERLVAPRAPQAEITSEHRDVAAGL